MAADQITLTAETGRPTGTRASRRLRAEGKIPGVVYGLDTVPKAVAVEWSALRAALTTDAGMNALIDLEVDGEKNLTMVYDMQRHPVRREVTHVDFILVDVNKTIDVEVPIILEDTEGDNLKGLVVDQQLFALPVSAKPNAIPNEFVVSAANLSLDEPVRVSDVTLPAGVELNIDPEEAVVTALLPQAVEAPAEGEEAAAGEAAAPVAAAPEAEGGEPAEAAADEGGEAS